MLSKSKLLIIFILIISVTLISVIVFPTLNNLFVADNNKPISEFWLLGPERTAVDYPSTVTSNEEYTIYLGVANQLNEDADYSVRVKLCDSIEQFPNIAMAEPSQLSSIEEFDFSLSDEQTWENKLVFALNYLLIQENVTRLENIAINGATFPVNRNIILDSNQNEYYIVLLFELWCSNGTNNVLQYTNQYLNFNLKLNN